MADSQDRGLKAMKNQGRDAEVSEIAAKGGHASHNGGTQNSRVITNKSGGGHLTKKDQSKGGHASGGNNS